MSGEHDIKRCSHTPIEHAMGNLSEQVMMAVTQATIASLMKGEVEEVEAGIISAQAIWSQGLEAGLRVALADKSAAKRLVKWMNAKYEVTKDEDAQLDSDARTMIEAIAETPMP